MSSLLAEWARISQSPVAYTGDQQKYEQVLSVICGATGKTRAELCGKSRVHETVLARQVAMYVMRRLGARVVTVGKLLKRDASTVSYGAEVVREMVRRDDSVATWIAKLLVEIDKGVAV